MGSSDGLFYASDLTLSQVQAEEMGLEEIFLYTKHLVQRLDAIRIFKEEYLALKAMALINAGRFRDELAACSLHRRRRISHAETSDLTRNECVPFSFPLTLICVILFVPVLLVERELSGSFQDGLHPRRSMRRLDSEICLPSNSPADCSNS